MSFDSSFFASFSFRLISLRAVSFFTRSASSRDHSREADSA
nr:hypothetical protein [Streptomyces pactum]